MKKKNFYLVDISRSHLTYTENYAIVEMTETQSNNLPYRDDSVVEEILMGENDMTHDEFTNYVMEDCGYPSYDLVNIEVEEIFS